MIRLSRVFLLVCLCSIGLFTNCFVGNTGHHTSNTSNSNSNNNFTYRGITDWPPAEFVSSTLRSMNLCENGLFNQDKATQVKVMSDAFQNASCSKQFGAWLLHQSCITQVTRLANCNTSNPPQCAFEIAVIWTQNQNRKALISFDDKSNPDCEKACPKDENSNCKNLFSLRSYYVFDE